MHYELAKMAWYPDLREALGLTTLNWNRFCIKQMKTALDTVLEDPTPDNKKIGAWCAEGIGHLLGNVNDVKRANYHFQKMLFL